MRALCQRARGRSGAARHARLSPAPAQSLLLRDLKHFAESRCFLFCVFWIDILGPALKTAGPEPRRQAVSVVQLFKITHFFRWFPSHQLLFSLRNRRPAALSGLQRHHILHHSPPAIFLIQCPTVHKDPRNDHLMI